MPDRPEYDTGRLRMERKVEPMVDRPRVAQAQPPWRLLINIVGARPHTIGVQVREQLLVGRSDAEGRVAPDIDFGPFDGVRNGVSRRHATIAYQDDAIYIQDLDSTNGTRINGFQLLPGQAYRLRDGDEVEFGRMRVILRFVRSPRR